MATKTSSTLTKPPELDPQRAIPLIQRQIERGETLITNFNHEESMAWRSTTQTILDAAFGTPDRRTDEFLRANGGSFQMGNPVSIHRHNIGTVRQRLSLLSAFVEQLRDSLGKPSSPAGYTFHPEVELVSRKLLEDGHYKQAVFEAYVYVINAVKTKAQRTDLDGDSLMNHAFGCDNQKPILAFNGLHNRAELDEQRGMMFLFKGMVGLRNAKGHTNTLLNSFERAVEYLSLASLLLRLLETAKLT